MKSVNDALTLRGARLLQRVSVMTKQLLIDACGTAYSCHRSKTFSITKHRSGIKFVNDFILTVSNIIRQSITISNTAFYMQAQGFFKVLLHL